MMMIFYLNNVILLYMVKQHLNITIHFFFINTIFTIFNPVDIMGMADTEPIYIYIYIYIYSFEYYCSAFMNKDRNFNTTYYYLL
jgi:hypothetical protein